MDRAGPAPTAGEESAASSRSGPDLYRPGRWQRQLQQNMDPDVTRMRPRIPTLTPDRSYLSSERGRASWVGPVRTRVGGLTLRFQPVDDGGGGEEGCRTQGSDALLGHLAHASQVPVGVFGSGVDGGEQAVGGADQGEAADPLHRALLRGPNRRYRTKPLPVCAGKVLESASQKLTGLERTAAAAMFGPRNQKVVGNRRSGSFKGE